MQAISTLPSSVLKVMIKNGPEESGMKCRKAEHWQSSDGDNADVRDVACKEKG